MINRLIDSLRSGDEGRCGVALQRDHHRVQRLCEPVGGVQQGIRFQEAVSLIWMEMMIGVCRNGADY